MEPQDAMSRIHALFYMRKIFFVIIRQVPESTGLGFLMPKGDYMFSSRNKTNTICSEKRVCPFCISKLLTFFLAILLLASAAEAGRGRGGLGKFIGAGVGAVTGHFAEKEIQAAMDKDSYTGDGFVLTEQGIVIKFEEGDAFLKIKNPGDSYTLNNVIKTTNRVEVTKKAEWGNIQGEIPVCAEDTICALIMVNVVKEKILSVKIAMSEDPSDVFDLIGYESKEPGILDYIWNFIINNILWVAIVSFGLLGFLWDVLKKRKMANPQQREITMELSAEDLNKDR